MHTFATASVNIKTSIRNFIKIEEKPQKSILKVWGMTGRVQTFKIDFREKKQMKIDKTV